MQSNALRNPRVVHRSITSHSNVHSGTRKYISDSIRYNSNKIKAVPLTENKRANFELYQGGLDESKGLARNIILISISILTIIVLSIFLNVKSSEIAFQIDDVKKGIQRYEEEIQNIKAADHEVLNIQQKAISLGMVNRENVLQINIGRNQNSILESLNNAETQSIEEAIQQSQLRAITMQSQEESVHNSPNDTE